MKIITTKKEFAGRKAVYSIDKSYSRFLGQKQDLSKDKSPAVTRRKQRKYRLKQSQQAANINNTIGTSAKTADTADTASTHQLQPRGQSTSKTDSANTSTSSTGKGFASREKETSFTSSKKAAVDSSPSSSSTSNKYSKKAQKWENKKIFQQAQLEKAQEQLPTKKVRQLNVKPVDNGGIYAKKETVEVNLTKREYRKKIVHGSAPKRVAKAGTLAVTQAAHRKVSEVEDDNVGVKAGHRIERTAERTTRAVNHFHKVSKANKPFKDVKKAEAKFDKVEKTSNFYTKMAENPELQQSKVKKEVKAAQKQQLKKRYAKQYRNKAAAQKAKDTAVKAGKKAAEAAAKAVTKTVELIAAHPVAALVILGIILLIVLIYTFVVPLFSMTAIGVQTYMESSYLAEDIDITEAELYYTELETDLRLSVTADTITQKYPDYYRYQFYLDDIGHDPYTLMAYLTSVYEDFSFSDVKSVLQDIFDAQYKLELYERTEWIPNPDPDGEEENIQVKNLVVELTTTPLERVLKNLMEDESQQEIYDVLMESKGNRFLVSNPLPFDWSSRVTDTFGYRVHPTTGLKNYHKGLDIGVPENTTLYAAHDGEISIVGYEENGYGYYVAVKNDKGIETRYAHCNKILVTKGATVKKGDKIALSGNTGLSTGAHLHFEISVNGKYINPIYFTEF